MTAILARSSHRPTVSSEGWVFGRPGNRRARNRSVHTVCET